MDLPRRVMTPAEGSVREDGAAVKVVGEGYENHKARQTKM